MKVDLLSLEPPLGLKTWFRSILTKSMIDEKPLSSIQSLARATRRFEAVSKLAAAEVTSSSTLRIS